MLYNEGVATVDGEMMMLGEEPGCLPRCRLLLDCRILPAVGDEASWLQFTVIIHLKHSSLIVFSSFKFIN